MQEAVKLILWFYKEIPASQDHTASSSISWTHAHDKRTHDMRRETSWRVVREHNFNSKLVTLYGKYSIFLQFCQANFDVINAIQAVVAN